MTSLVEYAPQKTGSRQARNLGGIFPPMKIFRPPPWKNVLAQFKNIGHSSKNLGPSRKTLPPSWCPKLVAGLVPGRVIPKIWKTAHASCPASCSALMGGCKGTDDARCCHCLVINTTRQRLSQVGEATDFNCNGLNVEQRIASSFHCTPSIHYHGVQRLDCLLQTKAIPAYNPNGDWCCAFQSSWFPELLVHDTERELSPSLRKRFRLRGSRR